MKAVTQIIAKFVLLFILGFSMLSEAKAQKPEELLTRANSLYNENAFDSALVVYKNIIEQGYSSATLYYNIGKAYPASANSCFCKFNCFFDYFYMFFF